MADQKKPTGLDLLREPFPDHQISKLPKPTRAQTDAVRNDFKKGIRCKLCGAWHHPDVVHLDYVGHAALTDRLLDADPNWNWEPVTQTGLPEIDQNKGMWIKLTVCGVTRLGYGHAEGKNGGDAIKEVIGDALRNAAMRFGAALDLWHKGDLHGIEDDGEAKTQPKQEQRQEKPKQDQEDEAAWFSANLPKMFTADQINAVLGRAKKAGRDVSKLVAARANELSLDFDPEARAYVAPDGIDDEIPY
jgi:hypothetical protein